MYYAILLLYAFSAAVDKPPPCGLWLVNAGNNDEFEFSGRTLSCKPVGESLRQIIFNSARYDNVTCDASGFKGNPVESNEVKQEVLMADSGWPLSVSCSEYCVTTPRVGIKEQIISYNVKEVRCADDTFDLYHNNTIIDGNIARCNTKMWSQLYHGKALPIDNLKPQQFECKKASPRCIRIDSKGLEYNIMDNTLSCNGGNTLWKIEFNSKVYESLRCEKHVGTYVWKFGNNIVADASTALAATCIEPCSIRSGTKIRFNNDTQNVTCAVDGTSFPLIEGIHTKGERTESLKIFGPVKCDTVNGWSVYKGGSYEYLSDPYNLRYANCLEYCASSGEGTKVKKIDDSSKIEVTCSDPGSGIRFKSKMYRYLECSLNSYEWRSANWTEFIDIADRSDRLDLECVRYPRPRCVKPAGEGIKFDIEKKTLTCEGGGIAKAIKLNSNLYEYLACDEASGWVGESNNKVEVVAEADVVLDISCVEYCKATGNAIKVEWELGEYYQYNTTTSYWHTIIYVSSFGNIKVTCPDRLLLIFNGNRVDKDTAICTLFEGWGPQSSFNDIGSYGSNTTMQFECRPEQTPISTTTSTSSTTPTTSTTITSIKTFTQASVVSTSTENLPKTNEDNTTDLQNSAVIITSSFGGILLLIFIIMTIIFIMRRSKKNRANNSYSRKNSEMEGNIEKNFKSDDKSARNGNISLPLSS